MPRNTLKAALAATLVLAGAAMAGPAALAGQERVYRVTVTNITRGIPDASLPGLGQIITPSVVATHQAGFSLFTLGQPASAGLALLAETGDPGDTSTVDTVLYDLDNDPAVHAFAVAVRPITAVLFPGQSASVEVQAEGNAKYLSATAMLAVTNDGFYALRSLRLPNGVGDVVMAYANAYDAGSEANTEDCDDIPAPPCDNAMNNNPTADAEGFVHVHAGIHGVGDLDPETHDWRNPVAAITVERIE